jgi:succinate dehydrogenase / fumarate reductase cytochrome b subunit
LYLVYHIMHFTLGAVPGLPYDPEDVYGNVVRGFQIWPVAVVYIVAMVLLSLHLYHGVWSFFQSLGLNHPRYNRLRRQFATVMTVVVCGGFLSVPVAVLAGWVK